MKPVIALVFVIMSFMLSVALTACDEAGGDYYENEKHDGYPGPATKDPNLDG